MDQAASTHQGILWYQRERREDSNLDRRLDLRAGRDHPKAAWLGGESLPNSTDSQRYTFEKTPILQAFQEADSQPDSPPDTNQLILFEF